MRVLLVRAGALGDLLLLRRTIARLQQGGHSAGLLAPAGPAAALDGRGPGDVERVLDWGAPAFAGLVTSEGPGPAAARALARYDAAIAYTRNPMVEAGLRRRIGRVAVLDPMPAAGWPAAEWLESALAAIGLEAGGGFDVPPLEPSADDHRAAEGLAAVLPPDFVAIHPGSGSAAKNWPAERFAALARALAPERWLLVWGPADDEAASPLAAIPGAVIARDLPLRALAALLARAGAYLGNDSGITHLAAAAGAPTVALFGPTDPAVWAPAGAHVQPVDCGPAMDAAVEEVAAALAERRRR